VRRDRSDTLANRLDTLTCIDADIIHTDGNCGQPWPRESRAIWMAVAGFLLIALVTSRPAAFGRHSHGVLPVLIAECSFLSLIIAYVSMYWFACDELTGTTDQITAINIG
jgi:hypothetical protein